MKKYIFYFITPLLLFACTTSNSNGDAKSIEDVVTSSTDTLNNTQSTNNLREFQDFFWTYISYTSGDETQSSYVLNPYVKIDNNKKDTVVYNKESFRIQSTSYVYIPIVSITNDEDTVFKDNYKGKRVISIDYTSKKIREDYFEFIDSLYYLSKVNMYDYPNKNSGEELFFDFFHRFITDNLFKMERTVWPLKAEIASISDGNYSLKDTIYWSHPLVDDNDYYFNNIILNNSIEQIETSDTIYFYFEGHLYGYIFIKKNGEYLLEKLLSHHP